MRPISMDYVPIWRPFWIKFSLRKNIYFLGKFPLSDIFLDGSKMMVSALYGGHSKSTAKTLDEFSNVSMF